jgi:hypothetical protein
MTFASGFSCITYKRSRKRGIFIAILVYRFEFIECKQICNQSPNLSFNKIVQISFDYLRIALNCRNAADIYPRFLLLDDLFREPSPPLI